MRLYRSRDDVMFSGLLAGIGEYFQIDPTIIRIVVAILFFTTPFPVVPLYVLGAILVPKAPKDDKKRSSFHEHRSRRGRHPYRNRMDREFGPHEEVKRPASPYNKEIDEDDWSDF